MDGRIAGFPDLDGADLQFSVTGPELAAFKRLLNLPDSVTGAFDLKGSVTSGEDGADVVQFTMATPLVNFNSGGAAG